jgi:hypothetical protein
VSIKGGLVRSLLSVLPNRQRVIGYVAFAIKRRPIFTFTKGIIEMALSVDAKNVQKKPPRRVAKNDSNR